MTRVPLKIGTTQQLERAVREAGYEAVLLPEPTPLDIHGSIEKRLADGRVHHEFLQRNNVDLVVDFNTTALTFIPDDDNTNQFKITTAALEIPFASFYQDPVTSTMHQVKWEDHWHILEQHDWIKCMYDTAATEELARFGIPNVVTLPMSVNDYEFDTTAPDVCHTSPVVAFMGHPATSWFSNSQNVQSGAMFAGLMCAAARADMPDLPFHKLYYDMYAFAEPVTESDDRAARAAKSARYFNDKFIYNAFLALKQRDRFVRFLHNKLGDAFELVGDHWSEVYGLKHTPRVWDRRELYDRIRRTPICINLMKGCLESGLNLRHFEVTACGGFLLTYATPELPNFFEVGTECDVFRNEQELLQKIDFYLSHPKLRNEIARAGQQRTLSQHLYSHRIERIVDVLRRNDALPGHGEDKTDATAPTSLKRGGALGAHAGAEEPPESSGAMKSTTTDGVMPR